MATLPPKRSAAKRARNRTDDLTRRLSETIAEEGLIAGGDFMTEEQIATRFNASRRVAREAIGNLRTLGVLQARQRRGLTISKPDPIDLLGKTMRFFVQSPDDFWELARFRYTLEIGALDMAVINRTDAQLQEMDRVAQLYADLVEKEAGLSKAIYEAEYTFHRLILEASGSALIAGLHGVLLDYFHVEQRTRPFPDSFSDTAQATAWEHLAIAQAIRQRDVERARALLRHHLHHQMGTTTP